jgi:class 3 adenylate cyclase
MVKEITAQGGYVDKFIGDAIMAVFKGDYHLDRAVEACLGVRKQIENMPDISNNSFSPKVSIGINCGEVISGNIGSANVKRLDYTVIGDVVNTAQRLQSVAKAGQIIINEGAYEKIKESFNCNRIGEVNLKNKKGSTVVYEVLN